MIGIYRIYKNNQLISENKNLITNFGKIYTLRYLSGQVIYPFSAIAIGTSNIAATVNDVSLGLEFSRAAVDLKSFEPTTENVIVRASFIGSNPGVIYEVGIFPGLRNPNTNISNTKIISYIDPTTEFWTTGLSNTTNFRVGVSSLELSANSATTTSDFSLGTANNFSGYSSTNQFALGYFLNDSNCSNITVKFQSDPSNYYQYSFSPGTTTGYNIKNFTKASVTTTGTPDWSNINSIEISITGTGSTTVQLDALSIIDNDYYQDYGLISHTILSTPIQFLTSEEVSIEYSVEFNI